MTVAGAVLSASAGHTMYSVPVCARPEVLRISSF